MAANLYELHTQGLRVPQPFFSAKHRDSIA